MGDSSQASAEPKLGGGAYAALAGTSLLGGFMQMGAANAQASYTRQVYEANSDFARAQAADAIRRGNVEAAKYKRKVKGLLGKQRAALAASGIDVSDMDSSAFQLQEETLKYGYADVQQIKNNAFREAMGLKFQATQLQTQGNFMANSQRNAGLTSLLNSSNQALGYGLKAYADMDANKPEVKVDSQMASKRYSGI
jgi:hypothetical protein